MPRSATAPPHPEEREARLEGAATQTVLVPILRDAALRAAPQDEVNLPTNSNQVLERLLGPRADVGDDLGGGDAAQPRAFGERLAAGEAMEKARGVKIAGTGRVDDLADGRGRHGMGFAAFYHDRAFFAAGQRPDLV